MKISELTKNDVIHIRNKKEAKGIKALLSKKGITYWQNETELNLQRLDGKPFIQVFKDAFGTSFNYIEKGTETKNIIPASKFLKPSLKKRVKELEKWRKQLEQPKTATDIEVHFDEVEKLPEKWCVKHSPEALEWIRNNAEQNGSHIYERCYYMFPANVSGNNSSNVKPDGYTEISFETFKRLVLKEDEKPVEIDFSKAGQLVKGKEGAIVITDGNHSGNTFSGFRVIEYCHHSDFWAKDKFTLYTEPVNLSN